MSKKVDKMRQALMRSNTRLLLSAVMLLQFLSMAVIAFAEGGVPSQQDLGKSVISSSSRKIFPLFGFINPVII